MVHKLHVTKCRIDIVSLNKYCSRIRYMAESVVSCSKILITSSDYIRIFYCFSTFGTILNIIIIILLSANPVVGYLLKDCYIYSLQTLHTGRPLSHLV